MMRLQIPEWKQTVFILKQLISLYNESHEIWACIRSNFAFNCTAHIYKEVNSSIDNGMAYREPGNRKQLHSCAL